jgi:hypothetical protein
MKSRPLGNALGEVGIDKALHRLEAVLVFMRDPRAAQSALFLGDELGGDARAVVPCQESKAKEKKKESGGDRRTPKDVFLFRSGHSCAHRHRAGSAEIAPLECGDLRRFSFFLSHCPPFSQRMREPSAGSTRGCVSYFRG